MAPIDHETQLRFLVSCIRNSDGGKPDFDAVAKDQGIVSKGAASQDMDVINQLRFVRGAKRYERLVKQANGPKPAADSSPTAAGGDGEDTGGDGDGAGPSTPKKTTPKKRAAPRAKKATPAKRTKKNKDGDDAGDDADVESAAVSTPATAAKKRAPRKKATPKSEPVVKDEDEDEAGGEGMGPKAESSDDVATLAADDGSFDFDFVTSQGFPPFDYAIARKQAGVRCVSKRRYVEAEMKGQKKEECRVKICDGDAPSSTAESMPISPWPFMGQIGGGSFTPINRRRSAART
ncbi:hypothetical protein MKZ38_000685 [Zalerion maritima]|uniref:Myb-like DNA-binding domain-containing protein n=1 Tax=Zalerion maritima TaxID=339359 RepID=A0AAD5RR99_9PEZI|nr:hypothetical protein MKZ38_000685 [Zalerion maritima]